MNAESVVAVSAAVVALVQLCKWAGLPPERGPLAVVGISLLGVLAWAVSEVSTVDRTLIWPLLTGWVGVATSAAGVFGFTRAAPEAISSFSRPPDGAGSEPVDSAPPAGDEIDRILSRNPYVIHHDGHPALLALVPPDPDTDLAPSEARHLNGAVIDPSDRVTCDRCGAELVGLEADGTRWLAFGDGEGTD